MKTTRPTLAKTTLALLVTAGLLGSGQVFGQSVKTWTGGTPGALNTAAGWSGGSAPASGDGWLFNTATLSLTNNFAPNYSVGGITFQNVTTFTSFATSAATQFLTLTGGITNSQTTAALVNFNNWNFIVNTSVLITNTVNSASSQLRPGQFSGSGTITYGANGGTARLLLQPGAGNNNGFTGRMIADSGRIDIGATSGVSSNTAYTFNNSGNVYLGGTNGEANFHFGVLDGVNTATIIQNSTAANTKSFSVGGKNINGDFAGVIGTNNSSTISIVKVGSATQTLSGINTYSGTTTISGGVLQLGNGGTRGSISNSTSVTLSGGSLAVNRSDSVAQGGIFKGALTGTGGFIQVGTGTTTLTAANTYSGRTEVRSGTLALSSSGSIDNSTNILVNGTFDLSQKLSTFTLGSGKSLSGSGTVTGQSVTAASGSTLAAGNSPGNLTVSSLILNGGANYNWEITDAAGVAGTGYDLITAGTLDLSSLSSSSKFNINLWSLSSSSATNGNAQNFNSASSFAWTVASYTSLVGTFSSNLFNINTSATNGTAGFANTFAGNFDLITNNNSIVLTYSGGVAPNTWTNASGNLSAITITNGATLTFDGSGTGGTVTNNVAVQALNKVVFSSGTTVNYTLAGTAITLDAGVTNSSSKAQTLSLPLTLTAGQTFNAAGAALTVSGAIDNGGFALTLDGANQTTLSGALSGDGSLVKNGAGAATLSGSSSFSGGTILNAGTLEVGNASALGTGTLTAASNSVLQATASATLANAVVLSTGSTLTVNDNGNALGLSGSVSGSGSLSKNGTGTLTLGGNNSYTGSTVVSAGTLRSGNANALGSSALTVSAGAAVDLAGNNLTTASIAGTGKVTNSTGSATLTLGDAGITTFAGSLADGGGTLALVKTNFGTVNLTGASTASGGATVAAGTLALANASFGSAITTLTGATLKASGSTLNGASIGGNGTSFSNTIGSPNFTVSNSTLNGVVTIAGPASGLIAFVAPNMPSTNSVLGANYGYAQFSNGVTATNVVVNGRLDLLGSGSMSISGITGSSNGNTNFVGGGSGAIVSGSTYAAPNSYGGLGNVYSFVAGGNFSGFFLGKSTFATLIQTGSGTTSFGMLQYAGNNTALPTNNVTTFSGGNWAIGQLGQNNGSQMAFGTFNLNNGANITVGGNTGAGTPGYSHGFYNINSGSMMTFLSGVAQGGGNDVNNNEKWNTLQFNVASNGVLNVTNGGGLQLGVNAPGLVTNPSSLTVNGGTVNLAGNLQLGNAANATNGVTNNVVNVTLNSGVLNVGGYTYVGYGSASGLVVNEKSTLTINGGKFLAANVINAPTALNAGSTITSSFIWNGGQISALSIVATNANWNGVDSSITGSTLYNSNGVLAPGDQGTAGRTTITGNYSQTGNGTLALDLGGVSTASSFTNGSGYNDYVNVTGSATLGGTVKVSTIGNAFYNIGGSTASSVNLLASTNLSASDASYVWGDGTTGASLSSPNNAIDVTLTTNATSLQAVFTRNTWNGGGNWGTGGTSVWSRGVDPNSTNDFALFGSNSTVNLDRSSTVYSLGFLGGSNMISSDNGSVLTLAPGVGTTVSINNVSGNNTVAVPLSLGGDLSVAASGTVTLSGGVSGNGGVTVSSGTVDLSGNNSYAGATLLKGGTLKATYNGSSSITATNSGVTFIANMGVNTPAWASGALSSIAAQMTNATLGVDATGTTVALTDAIANTNGGVTVAAYGNGTLSLVSDTDYTGVSNWKANGGTLSVTNVNALGTNSVTLTGGALSYDGGADTTIANNVTVTAGGFTGSIVNNTGYTLGLTGTLTKNNAILKLLKGAFNVTGNIEGSLANSDLFVSGATATLSGTNTYNGPTHIDTGATVTLGSATALPAATSLELGSASDTAEQVNGLNLAGYSATVSALNSTGLSSAKVYDTVGGGTLTVNGDSTFAGSIGDSVLGNNLNLTVGAGTASLSGNNSFTGVATVNSGAAINLGTTGQLSGVSTVNLNGGSLLIGGNNQVNSAANLSMNGGTVSLASTSTGSSFSNLTLTGNSVINFSGLTAGSSLTFTGVVNSLGGNTLSVYNYNPGVTSLVFNGESFGGLTDTDLSNVRFFSDNGLTSLGSAGGSFSGTEIVPVPEPSVILAAILMVALMAFAKREEISRLARRVTVR